MAEPFPIQIDIVSDVVCPWCAIGYRQLERAVGQLGDRADVSVRWHPFQLAPDLPPEGKTLADYSRDRYGATPEQAMTSRSRIMAIGESIGLEFHYSPDSRIYNTGKAHRLLVWAGEHGKQTALKMALFIAYFKEQRNVSDDAVLLAAAETAGLDRDEAQAALENPAYGETVTREAEYWQDQNVTGVPAFVINGKYMVPGAQDAETFVRVIERVIERGVV